MGFLDDLGNAKSQAEANEIMRRRRAETGGFSINPGGKVALAGLGLLATGGLAGAVGAGGAGTAAGTAAGSGALSRIGNFLKGHGRDILTAGGAVYSGVQGARNQGRANELNDQALQLALADYEDRKPLRQAFTQGALTPIAQAPDLSSVFAAARSDNPFATGGAPRSAHVPSQLPPMGRYGNGKTVDGPLPALSPMGPADDLRSIDLSTKSPTLQTRIPRTISRLEQAALPPLSVIGSGRSAKSRMDEIRRQTGTEQGGRRNLGRG